MSSCNNSCALTPYTLMQAIAAEGDVVVSGATEPEWYYVIVLAGHPVWRWTRLQRLSEN
ncbi:TPA: hypothetical protein HIE77_000851 [Escherichia coli]|nr:hypothetical protein [Escherichia coli]